VIFEYASPAISNSFKAKNELVRLFLKRITIEATYILRVRNCFSKLIYWISEKISDADKSWRNPRVPV
jgi:chemotaxis methyl-accepting protein methylase